MTADRWQQVGVALRRARGTVSTTEAAARSGNSRQWWLEAEKGVRPPRPEKLARAVISVGGDLREIFELAGYDPAPFLAEAGPGATPPPNDDDRLQQLLVAFVEMNRRLDVVIERLEDRAPAPAAPASATSRPPRRGEAAT